MVLAATLIAMPPAGAQSAKQINALPAASSVGANDVTVVQQGDGVTRQATAQQFVNLFTSVGITASSIQPITVAGGVFGGTVPYTFSYRGPNLPSLIIAGNGLQGNSFLELSDTTNTANAPNKYLRTNGTNGNLEILNSGGNTIIGSLSDAGYLTLASGETFGGTATAPNFIGTSNNTYNYYQADTSCGTNGYAGIFNSTTVAVQGIYGTVFGVGCAGPTYTFGMTMDTTGNLGIGGVLYSTGVVSTGTIVANNGTFASPAGVPINICFGPACPVQINTGGGLAVAALSVVGASSLSTVEIGPDAPSSSNYITHGQTGTYPYVSGVYNGNEHIEPIGPSNLANLGQVTINFKTPYQSAPLCATGFNQSSGTNSGGVNYSSTTTSATLTNLTGATGAVSAICIGH